MSTRSTLPLRSVFLAALLLCGAVTGAYADDQIPAWMTQAARGVVPSYDKDVPAVVLHDEQQITYSDGRLLSVENYAVKLLSKEGRRFAVARAYYLVSSGKVKDIVAWLIPPGRNHQSV